MPLHDHFRPPLSVRRHRHSFHNAWATYIAADLNRSLPEGYFAEANVQFGIEIDVATFEEAGSGSSFRSGGGWSLPEPVLSVPMALVTDVVEVQVFQTFEGPILAAAVELVSPANKDRPDSRDAFVNKCAAYLQQGVGLILVDVVTARTANLHHELLLRVATLIPESLPAPLYAIAYRPARRNGQTHLEVWTETLSVGHLLPTLPLWLRGGPWLALDLEATYERTCQEQRVPVDSG